MQRIIALAFAVALLGGPSPAQIYSAAHLAGERSRIEARIEALREVLTRREYLGADAAWLAQVPVQIPDRHENGDPLGFFSDGRSVTMPLDALLFVEDLTMAYAWRERSGRSLEPMDEYLAMLRWKPLQDWPDGYYLEPLTALGVPPAIWESDASVGDLGTRLRNEAWAFILSHELGHVYHRHPGNTVPAPEVQENERAADAFALTLMERTDTIPLGAVLYFQATAGFYPGRVDLPTDAAYARWQREEATHPVNADRLLAMAIALQLWSRGEPNAERADILRFIGSRLEEIATILADPAQQQLVVRNAVYGDPNDLRSR
jgi:hypothetical protein